MKYFLTIFFMFESIGRRVGQDKFGKLSPSPSLVSLCTNLSNTFNLVSAETRKKRLPQSEKNLISELNSDDRLFVSLV